MDEETNSLPQVGVDVGGTFTDFVVITSDGIRVHKAPTTPDDQSRAIVAGLSALGIRSADIVHGMTVATNALLERAGARTALLTTDGFADVLTIGRQNRPELYAFTQQRPQSLVADEWRLQVRERLDCDGEVLTPLDADETEALAQRLRESDIQSLAIVFLFSFRNPEHETEAADIIRQVCPELPITLSSNILPEYREYERTATTVINAYVQPLVANYLSRLAHALPQSQIRVMQSNGGAIGLEQAAGQAARVVLSGPAGGVVGAFALAQQAMHTEHPQIITFDMGGTSTDVALCPGQIPATSESVITDLPLRLPVIDIHTVGAGGGSIAYVDAGGGLRVGPRSAGAVPGPACYGRGGQETAVTDANLVLGRLDPDGFLGGSGDVVLDPLAAHKVLSELGQKLNLSPEEAALGVVQIANATMERALRRVSVEQGHDPRQFTLMPFGGAGPLHACDLAEALGIQRILIPPIPGVLSAYGMLVADIASDASQSVLMDSQEVIANPAILIEMADALAATVVETLQRDGVQQPYLYAALDIRYKGQSYELTTHLSMPIGAESVQAAVDGFHTQHAQRYGYAMADEPTEIVNLRMRGSGSGAKAELPSSPLQGKDASAARLANKQLWFVAEASQTTACYDRSKLVAGNEFVGPALVFQFDSTIVVAPGWACRVDEFTNLWLEYA